MSSLIVEVCRIDRISPHPNADRLELAQIKGWQVVVGKGSHQAGEMVTYVPVDSVLPAELSDRIGVTKYLSSGRVRCARLRGEPSFGLVMKLEGDWPEGANVAEHYGITKYIPTLKLDSGDAESEHPAFCRYTDIENMRHYPTVIADREEVVVTEKIHGTNCRVGVVLPSDNSTYTYLAGSKGLQRKCPPFEQWATNLYWHPLSLEPVRALLTTSCSMGGSQVILFGEVYGKVQSLRYGMGGGIAFRAFDLLVNGAYLDYDIFLQMCQSCGVPTVPELYRGPFSLETIRSLSEGPSAIPGADHIREGVVVKPVRERRDPKVGRVILKYVGDAYLLDQKITDAVEA